MPKCSFGCAPSGVPMHRFPNADKFPERLKAWVNLVGGKLETEFDYAYYQKKLVCDIHFTATDRNRNNRLNALAVPSLHLHGTSARQPDISLVTQPSDLHATNTGTSAREPDVSLVSQPSDLHATNTVPGALDITTAKTSPLLISINKSFCNDPPESRQTHTVTCPDRNPENTLKEHSYCANDKTDIAKAGKSLQNPTPSPHLIVNQLQTARKRVKQLQSEINRLRKRNKIFKTRLINAKKNSKHNCLQKITQNMTAAAKIFTHMQYTQTQKKNKGRRFTLEGQELCLSIYKSHPKCYDLLSKVFTLPSAKTLKSLIRKQRDIQPGLSIDLDEGTIRSGTFGDEPNYMDCVDIF